MSAPVRLVMAGYFGSGNLGDDAILLGFIHGLGNLPVEVTVLSGSPEETYRLYGFNSVPRKDVTAVKNAIQRCDALVYPGGSIFQDVTSVKSVKYYQALVGMAKAAGKKVFLLGQGVGPVKSFFGKRWTADAYNKADAIAVRDPGSMALLKSIGVTKPIRVTADSALLLDRPADSGDGNDYNVGNMKAVGVSVRPYGKGKDVVNLFSDLCKRLFAANYMPVLIEMDRNEDGPLILEISKSSGGKIPDLRKLQTPMQLQQRLCRMDAVIAMRLHAGVLAASVGIPPFMVSYDPKVTAFAKLLDLAAAPPMEGLTGQRLFDLFMDFQKSRERHEKLMQKKLEELRAQAEGNVLALRDSMFPAV